MSVDKRMRADMNAIGQAVNPDALSALQEVETMAGRQSRRRSTLLAVTAAVVLLVGIAAVPAVGNWWQGGQVVESADSDAQAAADPEVEALLDELTAATNAADAPAVVALLTEDATYFGTPVAETAPGGLAVQIKRYAGYGLERADVPALVVSDGFDYAIAYRGTTGSSELLYLVRARAMDDGLKIYEITTLKGP